ncbi:spindle assembly abnormal protein 6 homolog isoform X4 [Hippocampus zosterae]|uniref:spindle assembly abnormal protein 6 homolog isoform X4 n=1 Tax=Hippocampus zosterae TaxID=109293 RepID=UPI00223E1B54|nr:spindle assembly abnormal protein 6 homolog isoform X4 [Hippocampus zosterae]
MEAIFSKVLKVVIKCRHCNERKEHIRVTIELESSTGAICKRDLLVRLTNDSDPHFLFSLTISEEDFQSLKVQQSLLIEFTSFPEMLTQLLRQCQSEQNCSHPRFQLLLSFDSPSLDGPAQLNVMESSSFKHLNLLSLQLAQASDKQVKDYLAACLASLKTDKEALEVKLQTTEDDLTKRLHNAEQALSEKSTEMERLHLEWTLQRSSLSNELQSERQRAAELQERLRQETQQVCRDLESAHQRSSQQMQSRLAQLETSCAELGDRNFKNEAALRDLKSKLAGAEEERQRLEQRVGSADAELHAKERLAEQLRARVAALEQEVQDKEWKMSLTQEALMATQQQQGYLRKSVDDKEVQLRQFEAQVEVLAADVKKGNEIIRKFQCELQVQLDKSKYKSTVLVMQEKIVRDTSAKLERAQQEAQDARRQLDDRDRQIASLKEQLESSGNKLSDANETLQKNERVIDWLNKLLNEKQLHEKFPETSENAPLSAGPRAHFSPYATASRRNDFAGGLDAKYFKGDDGIPGSGLAGAFIPRELPPPRNKAPVASAYFHS